MDRLPWLGVANSNPFQIEPKACYLRLSFDPHTYEIAYVFLHCAHMCTRIYILMRL